MYSNGWGKKLTYVTSVSSEQVVDTTAMYVDKYDECLERRALCSESWLKQYINTTNTSLLSALSSARRTELQTIQQREHDFLTEHMQHEADKTHLSDAEQKGRQTGSEEWKAARGETGKPETTDKQLPATATCTVPDAMATLTSKTQSLSVTNDTAAAVNGSDSKERIKQLFAQYVKQLTTGCANKACTNIYCKNNTACTTTDPTSAAKQALMLVKQYRGDKLCS